MGTLHFKNKVDYDKWLAYGHMHKSFDVPGCQKVVIAGVPHHVRHKRK